MVHQLPDSQLKIIEEMDRKIGEFMQMRAELVNRLIAAVTVFNVGDLVEVYDGSQLICTGSIIQPIFIKKQGLIAYRIRKDSGEVFTNQDFLMKLVHSAKSAEVVAQAHGVYQ